MDLCQIENSELRELSKQREVEFEVVHKFCKTGLWPLKIGERHQRRRDIGGEKHRKLVDEVAKRRLRGSLSVIELAGQKVTRSFQLITEKANLFRLRFQIPVLWVGKDKIQNSNASLNVLDFVLSAVAEVLTVDLTVQPPRKQVVDDPALWERLGAGVVLGVKFVPETSRALPPMGVGEGQELTGHKVPRMCRHEVEKASFRFRVAESFQRVEMDTGNVHGIMIRAAFSNSSGGAPPNHGRSTHGRGPDLGPIAASVAGG